MENPKLVVSCWFDRYYGITCMVSSNDTVRAAIMGLVECGSLISKRPFVYEYTGFSGRRKAVELQMRRVENLR